MLVVIGTIAHMGGAERQALYLVRQLASMDGGQVEVLTFEDGGALRPELEALGVRIHVHPYYFRWPKGRRLRSLAQLAARLRYRLKPDVLLPFVGIHSKAIAQVWPFSGARFCWWNQQDEGRDLHGTAEEAKILRRVSCITSNSFAGRDFLVETYGLAPDSVLVYNNGTPLPDPVKEPGAFRDSLGIGSRPLVSMIANLTSFKDHATLLKAWKQVRDRMSGANRPVLFLAGHHREKATVTALKLQAFDVGLTIDDVRFLGPVANVAGLLADSDLVVHSSIKEGCPNAVCEAMAMGRPVVATDIPGCLQALGEDQSQWLVPPGDDQKLAECVVRMLEDAELRAQVGAHNRQRIESEFSIEGMNRFFVKCIEEGLGNPLENAPVPAAAS